MSLDSITTGLRTFLASPKPEILVIKGDWGIGKTYQWNRIVKEASKQPSFPLKQYAYVSLFGINSIEDLKLSMVVNTVPVSELAGSTVMQHGLPSDIKETGLRKAKQLGFWIRDVAQSFSPLKALSPRIVEYLSLLALKETLICVDDIERAGDNIKFSHVLGLANLLKEEHQCKIALIYNEKELENESAKKDDVKAIKAYFEKTVDIEMMFAPTPEECAAIAIPKSDAISAKLKDYCTRLKLNNIRIIDRIARMTSLIEPYLSELDKVTTDRVLVSLSLFAASRFAAYSSSSVPDRTFIETFQPYQLMWQNEGEDREKDEHPEWTSLLIKLHFVNCTELDLEIAKLVDCGYVPDESSLRAKMTEAQAKAAEYRAKDSFTEAWNVFIGSFDPDIETAIENLCNAFKSNMSYLEPLDADAVVHALRELNKEELIDGLVQEFLNLRFVDLYEHGRRIHSWSHVKDEGFRTAISRRKDLWIEERKQNMNLGDVLARIASEGCWKQDELAFLSGVSEEDYYDLFKTVKDPELADYIGICSDYEMLPEIKEKATQALRRIADEHRINALRMKWRGLKIEP